jgi:hypothetical protein
LSALTLLLSDGESIWSVEELVAEVGRRLEVIDSVAALQAAGLVHRCHDFVFATRAAPRCTLTNWTFDEQSAPGSKVGAPDCLSTDARRRADGTGRKAAAPASAARPRAVRTTIRPSRPIRFRPMSCERRFGNGTR